MNSEKMEKQREKILDMCICSSCPSWVECDEKGGFCFPTVAKSSCIDNEKGCICAACPATDEMGLKHDYYCTRGSDKEQYES